MFNLDGHVAMITGGSRGIGLGLAKGVAKCGASVAILARNAEKTAEAVAELEALGVPAAGFSCDVAQEPSVADAVASVIERFGRIDSCFANAGIGRLRPTLELTAKDWDSVMDTNLLGVLYTFRESVKHMIDRGGGGKLIATASIGTVHGMPGQVQYSASKAGVCAMVRTFAVEFARHDIQANAVLPGWIETDMTAPAVAWEKLRESVRARTPARRWGSPEDLEGIAAYLASPASRFHTGDTLTIDGGYTVF